MSAQLANGHQPGDGLTPRLRWRREPRQSRSPRALLVSTSVTLAATAIATLPQAAPNHSASAGTLTTITGNSPGSTGPSPAGAIAIRSPASTNPTPIPAASPIAAASSRPGGAGGADSTTGAVRRSSTSVTTSASPIRAAATQPIPAGQSPAAQPTTTPTPAALSADFVATTGVGCTQNSSQGYYRTGLQYSSTSGGYTGSGCTGRYDVIDLLDDANRHTDGTYLQWWFTTTKLSSGSCRVWVWIPTAVRSGDASSTAYFAVIPNKDSWETLGTFTVNEASSSGGWAGGNAYPMRSGTISVKLLDRGYGRASASAVQVSCVRG